MSFMNTFTRLLQGKPAFDANDMNRPNLDANLPVNNDGKAPLPGEPTQEESTFQKTDPTTFPMIRIERTHTREHGPEIEIVCSIKNESEHEVLVRTFRLFGNTHRLDVSLRPGGWHEVELYKGPALSQQQGSDALVDYKTNTGDYFEATFDVHYHFTQERTYDVNEFSLRQPIRKIYG